MRKFLFELGAALVALWVVAVATFLFAPYDWFWPGFGVTVMVVILYIIYRFHRLWIKRCGSCGSLNITIERRRMWPDHAPPFGSKFDCENVKICHNVSCHDHLREQSYSCYIKSFSHIEILWRRIKGEDFPQ
jgi:hypothetical protein